VDSGNNLILAASADASDAMRSLALECGVELDDKGTAVYDHFAHQAAKGAADPALIATSHVLNNAAVFGTQQPQVCAAWGVSVRCGTGAANMSGVRRSRCRLLLCAPAAGARAVPGCGRHRARQQRAGGCS
jgi:hypothetical protein